MPQLSLVVRNLCCDFHFPDLHSVWSQCRCAAAKSWYEGGYCWRNETLQGAGCADMFGAILANGNVIVMGGDSCVDSLAGFRCDELPSTSRRPQFRYDLWEFQAATLAWVSNSRPHNSRR
jgi:hypothetical protein